jgi:hypothetical protein
MATLLLMVLFTFMAVMKKQDISILASTNSVGCDSAMRFLLRK